ncbi:MAG TPA: hypothetical protein VFQ43_12760 [Nitrososphaera sp.]|nr:hypothetical protein [Nitrososphaera sp.]
MKIYAVKKFMAHICLAVCLMLVLVPLPVQAQSSVGLSLRLSPTTVAVGGTVGLFGLVTNNTGSRLRTTVTYSSVSACGIETNIGSTRVALNPGQTIQVTASYPLAPDACPGLYAVSISANSGGKNAAATSATAYLTVQ